MTDGPFSLTSEAAKELSRLGASKGGTARANKLTPERRREIAQAAIQARWEKAGKSPLPRAIRKGNFEQDFGIDVDCYVLNDEARTAVISQRGMGQAIGFSRRGDRLTVFAGSKTMEDYIGRELREKFLSGDRAWISG